MKILKMIGNLFGRGLWRKHRLQQVRMAREYKAHQRKIKGIEMAQRKARVLRWPQVRMTQEEFTRLKEQNVDLQTCPLGTWFLYRKPLPYLPNMTIVGQVVAGGDLFTEQWGAGLSVPERGANNYRLEIVV